ncbi:MAG TPA: DUF357 domain-containing protein [Thermococcus sp.]|nr:MAG: DUF357 domain-containing protein [Thermoplasmata archaeon]RLF40000.1 MAG: DUF357 domain-containing protein [Thermoplasmata archaeon]HDH45134.1 DUF357 domain-containing protein [Thermococcus sp.]
MKEEERIKKDIELFEKIISSIKEKERFSQIIELSMQYCEDSKYYLRKGDYFTAFGCINYAHGLIDAIRIIEGIYPS